MTLKKKKTQKKAVRKKAKNGQKRKPLSQNMRVLLASLFLLGFVGVCLVTLVSLRESFLSHGDSSPLPEAFTYEEPSSEMQTTKIYRYEDILALIDNQLINGPDSMGWRKLPDEGDVQVRKIFGDFPNAPFLSELTAHIEQTGSSAELKVSRQKGIIHLFWQGQLHLELRYQIPPTTVIKGGRIAVIMDDLGGSLKTLNKLLDLDFIITPSILPGTSRSVSATDLLKQAGREYMIHIPMQPRSYPRTNPGSNALLLGQSEEKTQQLVASYLAAVPGAVGSNNHMGSRYTEDSDAMRRVLAELKRHDLFFIDSRTIGDSVAFTEARKMGVKTATRNIFLDNTEDVAYIRQQIRKMVRLAGDNREIIAICHPYKETLEAFRLEQEWLQKQSVTFVAASELVHLY
jgi:polysaccharide deacetylase 2 family uncharacterized protein YibQ